MLHRLLPVLYRIDIASHAIEKRGGQYPCRL